MENKLVFFILMTPMAIVVIWGVLDEISTRQKDPLKDRHVPIVSMLAIATWWAFYFI